MKAIVNKDTCIGCGLCVSICPDVFELNDNIAEVKVDEVSQDSKECANQTVEDCPVDAISLEE